MNAKSPLFPVDRTGRPVADAAVWFARSTVRRFLHRTWSQTFRSVLDHHEPTKLENQPINIASSMPAECGTEQECLAKIRLKVAAFTKVRDLLRGSRWSKNRPKTYSVTDS